MKTNTWYKYLLIFLIVFGSTIQAEQSSRYVTWKEFRIAETKSMLLKTKHRSQLINYLIAKHNYRKYLEIGVEGGANFKLVKAEQKYGVDVSSDSPCNFKMTSDEFFRSNQQTFDLIFIDGLHLHEQVLRDVMNSLKCLNPGGRIVLHDCLPKHPDHQGRFSIIKEWNGDVWKAAAYIRMHFQDVHMCVLDMDWGCGIITPNATQDLYPAVPIEQLDWDYFVQNNEQIFNVMTVEDWLETDH